MMTDIMEQMRRTFQAEALDLLIELDASLLTLEGEPGDATLVNRVFRAIHTIKGSGWTAGFKHLARFAHRMEEAFDLAREGRLVVTPDLIDCGLNACDIFKLILDSKTEGEDEDAPVEGESELTAAFIRLIPPAEARGEGTAESNKAKTTGPTEPESPVRAAFEIVFKPHRAMFYSGADPVTLLDDLREAGQAHITAHVDLVPALGALEAENCYLWWEILLVTSCDEAAIREVFVFAEDDCEVRIRLLEDQAAAVALFGSVPADSLELFVAECQEHLEGIESDALALENDPASKDRLDSLFRSVHTIKGNAGLLLGQVSGGVLMASHPLQLLLRVAHGLESVLDQCRGVPVRTKESASRQAAAIQTALDTGDAIRSLLGSLMQKGKSRPLPPELLDRLGLRTIVSATVTATPVADTTSRDAAFLSTTSQCVEMIAGCFKRLEGGVDSAGPVIQTWLRGLKTLSAAAQYRQCPELEATVSQQLLILNAAIKSGVTPDGESRVALGAAFAATRDVLEGISRDHGVPAADASQTSAPGRASTKGSAEHADAVAAPSTIRIDQNKLDRLMRVVGELLVARGAFPLLTERLNNGEDGGVVGKDLKQAGADISRIADDLQSSVMSIRMLQVKTVFQKFPRLVRDLARSQGKEVRFVIEGEGIEMDKTILEQIGDPLVHLIRNAVDHGLETPEERLARGKEACGLLTLRARYEAGGVAIEVTEDGRGLDAAALKRKGVDKGLISADAAAGMSDEAAYQLVFLPGLSTAAKVTDVSGRGVGMDVVRSNVRNLHGSIGIESRSGQGTTFLIKLPASLMISKGILLKAGGQEYIMPLGSIRDMVKLPAKEAHAYRGLTLAQVRGTIYPIFSLAGMMGLASAESPELSIAIVEAGSAKYGLVVDRFLTEVEVLVKPLAGGLEECKEFQGAAIMGDGRVVLVLNAMECHRMGRTACA